MTRQPKVVRQVVDFFNKRWKDWQLNSGRHCSEREPLHAENRGCILRSGTVDRQHEVGAFPVAALAVVGDKSFDAASVWQTQPHNGLALTPLPDKAPLVEALKRHGEAIFCE